LLARYLKIYRFRLDRAQLLLIHGMELRKKHSKFFFNRDPMTAEVQKVVETM